jgi:hypothetical protein
MTLFPRNPGKSESIEWQRRCRAHRILDRVRAGVYVHEHAIRWALAQTGDSTRQGAA